MLRVSVVHTRTVCTVHLYCIHFPNFMILFTFVSLSTDAYSMRHKLGISLFCAGYIQTYCKAGHNEKQSYCVEIKDMLKE